MLNFRRLTMGLMIGVVVVVVAAGIVIPKPSPELALTREREIRRTSIRP
jgi:hypothetical protein